MNYIDLTHKLTDQIYVYPKDPEFKVKKITNNEDDFSISKISGGLHTGTHIDAPYHYFSNGKKVSDLDINQLIGKTSILKMKNQIKNKNIKIDDIQMINPLEKIAILNTGEYKHWGKDSYFCEFPYISKELAKFLIENEISGICIDTCSVDKIGKSHIHKMFLKNNIWIVENLTNMDKLVKNEYYSYIVPMNIDAEASYVRVFVENNISKLF